MGFSPWGNGWKLFSAACSAVPRLVQNQGGFTGCGKSRFLGGRSFSSDNTCLACNGLQPLRPCISSCHTHSSDRQPLTLQLPSSAPFASQRYSFATSVAQRPAQ